MMMLVPAGKPVDEVIASLLPYLEEGDIAIDGGNSFYKYTLHRVAYLQEKGIHFMGMGISGGEAGARFERSMMPGGDKEAYQYLKPILEAIAAKAGGEPCVAFMGNGAQRHGVRTDARADASIKNYITVAVVSGIPAAGMISALAYFDAFCSERLPTNLIQAQRDYFGAHTYQRIDKEGVFHTGWHSTLE